MWVDFLCYLLGSVFSMLRPVWVARLISQVEDVAGYVVLCREIRHYPRFIGSGYLQTTHWTVLALPAPFINAFLTEAVCTGQDEVSFPIHADAALFFICQLLHSPHPHAGLTGVRGGEQGRWALGGSLCRQHLSSLAGDVTVQLDKLVQVHDP